MITARIVENLTWPEAFVLAVAMVSVAAMVIAAIYCWGVYYKDDE